MTSTTLTGLNILSAGTAAEWAETVVAITANVYAYETDTGLAKIGNGSALYTALSYHVGPIASLALGNGVKNDGSNKLTLALADGSLQVGSSGVSVVTSKLVYPVSPLGTESSGTVPLNRAANNWQQVTVAGSLTFSITNWPSGANYVDMHIQLINGGSGTITWPTINWKKTDGSGTYATTPALAGITFQTSGVDWITIWSIDGATYYAEVKR
jgi:hypothetical protein